MPARKHSSKMLCWLKQSDQHCNSPEPLSPVMQAAQREGERSGSANRKRKRSYNKFTPNQRAELADYARQHGNTVAARQYSKKWDIDISESTVRNIKSSLGWSNVKGTKAARKLPKYFDELKEDFLNCIVTKVQDHMIPKSLIINWDQTGVKMVPWSEWTMAEKGSKQVSITGLGD